MTHLMNRPNTKLSQSSKPNGFTMMELIIAVAILAIVVAFAIPGFNSLLSRTSITSDSNEFLGNLGFAKSEAIKRGQQISVNAITGDWQNGYTVNVESTSELLKQYVPVGKNVTPTEATSPSIVKVTFSSDGLLVTAPPQFSFCTETGEPGRSITLSATGRVQSEAIASCS